MNTSSSFASNLMLSTFVSKRDSNSVWWDYVTLVDLSKKDRVMFELYRKVMSGSVHIIKQHIAHIKGNVSKCPRSTKKDKEKCENDLNK